MSVLRATATGELAEKESQVTRITQFVEKGWLKISATKSMLALLKAELMCWYNLLGDTKQDKLPKKPHTKGNIKDLED